MKNDGLVASMRGTIVADETWIGGKPQNRHGYNKPSRRDPVQVVPVSTTARPRSSRSSP